MCDPKETSTRSEAGNPLPLWEPYEQTSSSEIFLLPQAANKWTV